MDLFTSVLTPDDIAKIDEVGARKAPSKTLLLCLCADLLWWLWQVGLRWESVDTWAST